MFIRGNILSDLFKSFQSKRIALSAKPVAPVNTVVSKQLTATEEETLQSKTKKLVRSVVQKKRASMLDEMKETLGSLENINDAMRTFEPINKPKTEKNVTYDYMQQLCSDQFDPDQFQRRNGGRILPQLQIAFNQYSNTTVAGKVKKVLDSDVTTDEKLAYIIVVSAINHITTTQIIDAVKTVNTGETSPRVSVDMHDLALDLGANVKNSLSAHHNELFGLARKAILEQQIKSCTDHNEKTKLQLRLAIVKLEAITEKERKSPLSFFAAKQLHLVKRLRQKELLTEMLSVKSADELADKVEKLKTNPLIADSKTVRSLLADLCPNMEKIKRPFSIMRRR